MPSSIFNPVGFKFSYKTWLMAGLNIIHYGTCAFVKRNFIQLYFRSKKSALDYFIYIRAIICSRSETVYSNQKR